MSVKLALSQRTDKGKNAASEATMRGCLAVSQVIRHLEVFCPQRSILTVRPADEVPPYLRPALEIYAAYAYSNPEY